MRRDIVHNPVLDDSGAIVCHDCDQVLPFEEGMVAVSTGSQLVEVAGLYAYYPSNPETAGEDTVSCTHPAAKVQDRELVIRRCDGCTTNDPECSKCKGSGMIAIVHDAEGNRQELPVSGGTWESVHADVRTGEFSIERVPKLSDEEKLRNRQAWNAFLQLREATRPEETKSS